MTPLYWEAQNERLIDSRETFTFYDNAPGGFMSPNAHYRNYAVGDIVTHFVAAPGTGRVVYRVTRIDDKGAWGVVVEDTVREML